MKKKIKIFVDGHSFDKEPQGTQTFLHGLYTAFLKIYPEVEVYIGAYNVKKIEAAFPVLIKTRILAYKYRGIGRFVFDIPAMIRKHDFDFAHFQYVSPRRVKNCRYIVTLHDLLYREIPDYFPLTYSKIRGIIFKRSFCKAHVKTTVSEYSRESIASSYKIPLSDIHVIPNAVDNSFSRHSFSHGEAQKKITELYGIGNYILYVSRMEPRKNHSLLLKAYLELEFYKKNIALVFIGSRSIKVPGLDNLVKSLSADQKKYVCFLNDISRDDLAAFYTACTVFVYPSLGEGFGIPPLEAGVCGAPVLCSDRTAMKDFYFFEPYTFNPAHENDFKTKLSNMIDHPVSAAFRLEVSNKIEQLYNWEKSAEKLHQLIQTLGA